MMSAATIPYLLIRRTLSRAFPRVRACRARCRRWRGHDGRCRSWSGVRNILVTSSPFACKHAGTWVILADPEDVKKVFTADHAVLGVGACQLDPRARCSGRAR